MNDPIPNDDAVSDGAVSDGAVSDDIADAPPPSAAAIDAEIAATLETENFIDTYQIVAEWIRFEDAKAAAVLAACGALAGVLVPTIKEFVATDSHITPWWEICGIVLFGIWLVFLIAACWWSFRCILPFRRSGRHPAIEKCTHFHPASIAARYGFDETSRFAEDASQLETVSFMKEVMAGLHLDSHISAAKYQRVSRAIQLLGVSAVFGFLYLVVSQF